MRASVALAAGLVAAVAAPGVGAGDELAAVRERLVRDGFASELVERSFAQARFLYDRVELNVFQRESKANYAPFLEPERIARAAAYLERHRDALADVERRFGVDAEVIVAILLVESDLGRYRGRHPVVSVLASLAAAGDAATLDRLAREHAGELPQGSRQGLERRVRRKAEWAYEQLVALLELARKDAIPPPAEIRGSWAGAFGISQFIPTSVRAYGADGDGDGRIDLYAEPDAFASIAHYLERHGWRPDAGPDVRRRAVLAYNRSGYYADTVLEVARRLGGAG